MLPCSSRPFLNPATISSWLRYQPSITECRCSREHSMLADFSVAAWEVAAQRTWEVWLAAPSVAVCLLIAPALFLHLRPFLISYSYIRPQREHSVVQPHPGDEVLGLSDNYLQIRDSFLLLKELMRIKYWVSTIYMGMWVSHLFSGS